MTLAYDPLAPNDWQNPYPDYARLRSEAPVHWSPDTGVFCVSRYDDVVQVLKDSDTFSSERAFQVLLKAQKIGFFEGLEILRFFYRTRINPLALRKGPPDMLITVDPPFHGELRNMVNRGFTPRRIQELEPRLREIVGACLGPCTDQERFDLIGALAVPLPVTVIAELLGVDPSRRLDFKRWSEAIVAGSSGSRRGAFRPFLRAMGDLQAFLSDVVKERRRKPQDDVISVLVDPRYGDTMDDPAVVNFLVLLLIAGNETTTNLIGNAVNTLLDHPDQLELLLAKPSLLPNAIEEVLRFEPPVHFVFRRARRDTEIAGTSIPAESKLAVLLASANRDDKQFDQPDRFLIERDTKGHLGFGFGVHFCLGASLARLEARVALEALLPELARRRKSDEATRFVDSFLVRGPERLELVRPAA